MNLRPVHRVEEYLLEKSQRLFSPVAQFHRSPDVEVVHRLRVNSRRLRVGLRFFGELFPASERRQACRQLRRVTRALGEVRTLDVTAQWIRRAARKSGTDPAVTTALLRRLAADRGDRLRAARELFAVLEQSQFPARVETMIRQARPLSERQWAALARAQLAGLRRAVQRRHRQFCAERTGRCFHRLRIAVKRYRYGLEAAPAAAGHRVGSRRRAVEALQDAMGGCHDAEVTRAYVREMADKKMIAGVAEMVDWLRAEREKRYESFQTLMKENRIWMKKVRG